MNKSNRLRGFTYVELICVVAISAALTTILLPVYGGVVLSAKTTASVERLRQLHQALTLYQGEYGGGWGYNNEAAVGLPTSTYVYEKYMGFDHDFFVSPCGYKEEIEGSVNAISYVFTPYFSWTEAYYAKYKQNAVVFADYHCNVRPKDFYDYFSKKRGLAMLLGGRIVNKYDYGNATDLYWFSEPP